MRRHATDAGVLPTTTDSRALARVYICLSLYRCVYLAIRQRLTVYLFTYVVVKTVEMKIRYSIVAANHRCPITSLPQPIKLMPCPPKRPSGCISIPHSISNGRGVQQGSQWASANCCWYVMRCPQLASPYPEHLSFINRME